MVSSCLQMEVSVTGTVGTMAEQQCAAALSSAKDASTEGGGVGVGGGGVTGERSVLLTSPFFLLSALPVLKAIKEQISSQREGR